MKVHREFKRQVVEELLSGVSTPAQLMRRHEISSGLLYHWKKQYAKGGFDNLPDQASALEVRVQSAFVYLAVIRDLFSRKTVGYAISRNIDTALSLAALIMAIVNRKPPKGIIHHSDQGVHYAAHDYVDILLEHGFQISMARKANPYDNATAESFIKTLKTEEVYLWEYRPLADVQLRLPYFIEQVYSHKRLHSSQGYLQPVEFEELFLKTHKPCPIALTQAV